MDECLTQTDFCDANASCFNSNGFHFCECNVGFFGNGKTCQGMQSN